MRIGTSDYEWDHSINNPSRIIIFHFYLPLSTCLRLCNPNLPPTPHLKHTKRAIYSYHRTPHWYIIQTQVIHKPVTSSFARQWNPRPTRPALHPPRIPNKRKMLAYSARSRPRIRQILREPRHRQRHHHHHSRHHGNIWQHIGPREII